jgi:CDP-diacylglycerol--serine O-phosphatidyltransferase
MGNWIKQNVPNLITGTSLLLGFASIVLSGSGHLEAAAWLVIWSVLLDYLDGIAARLLKVTSGFGALFDSLADLLAFGIAPAMLALNLLSRWYDLPPTSWVLVPCGVYALFAAIRLARFNADPVEHPGWFAGFPTTACGALVATVVILLVRYQDAARPEYWLILLPALLLLLAAAMVSGVLFPKPRLTASAPLNAFLGLNVVAVYAAGFLRAWPEYLFLVGVTYLVVGLNAGRRVLKR